MKKPIHHAAFDSGMRGQETPKAPAADAGAVPGAGADSISSELQTGGIPETPEKTAKTEKPQAAFSSGMRGASKPSNSAQATAGEVSQGLQAGTGLEAVAQGQEPKVIDAGDHYQIPKASLEDGGDHWKLRKKT